jgi:hypothetical protein
MSSINYPQSINNLKLAKKRAKKTFLNNECEEGWKLSKDEKGVKIYHGKGKNIHVKTTAIIKAPESDIIDLLNCRSPDVEKVTEQRQFWDPKVYRATPLLMLTEDSHISIQSVKYEKYSYLFGDREFVYISDLFDFNGCKAIVATSIDEEESEKEFPIEKGIVRGSCPLWAWVFRTIKVNENNEEDEKGGIEATEVTYLLEASPLGWIPSFVTQLYQNDQANCIFRIKEHFDKN